ncbi:MAG: RsiV family protein [Alistipes sp.]|nr:RsiV family protein [Alistipes senegalensis]MCM1251174.1 RsiV family protein [Alistipes sp.]
MKTPRILLALATVAALAACTRKPVEPRFAGMSLDTLLSRSSYDCRVEYRFASIANSEKSEALRTIQRCNIDYFFELEEFEGTVDEAVAESLRQIDQELTLPEGLRSSVRSMEYEISTESEGTVTDTLLCYMISRSSYLGGAHGMYSTEYHTYSLVDGYEFSAEDLIGTEKMEPLRELIRTKLYEQYDAADDRELSDRGFFPEYISVTNNFRVTPRSLIFHYNPYEIGCYANGDIDVEITCEELEAL